MSAPINLFNAFSNSESSLLSLLASNLLHELQIKNSQKIERLWGEFKQWKRQRRGFYLSDLDYYIQEFLWRREIKIRNKNPFEEIQSVLKR
jgi:hypothetical protein